MLIAPIPHDEAERLAALLAYNAFRTGPEPGFDRITSLAARTLGVPSAYVSLVGEDAQWLKSCFNLPGPRETSRDVAFCAHAILSKDVFVVPDATLDPRFADSPLVTGEPFVRFYAGCPLRSPSGHNVGTLCAIDYVPRVATPGMLAAMKDLAALVVDQLELRKWVADEETNYRRLADAIHGMVFRLRLSGPTENVYEYASPGALGLMGVTPEYVYERPGAFVERIHPDDLPSFFQATDAVWKGGIPWNWSGRLILDDGEVKWVQGDAQTERQADGSLIIEGLIYDVTKIKEREVALQIAKESAERANLAKSEFLSRMSHELRTPMNAILGFCQMLELEPLEGEAKEDLAQVRKAGEHLLGLINEVLDLSSLDARRMSVSIEPVRLQDVMSETVGLLRPLSEALGITLRIRPTDEDLFVQADRQRLKQIVINLVTNALKYNRPHGSATVEVRQEAGEIVALDVVDQGAGIPPECLDRLFTPFDRLGAEGTRVEGTGLGLAISRGLAERMGGSLTVASAVGQGSSFTLRLPQAPNPMSALPETMPAAIPDAPKSGTQRVLYVEDNESNILLIRRILRQRPAAQLTTVPTVAMGLESLGDAMPEVLLLDLNLPDGSGETILRWVRTESPYPDLPVIVLSADATPRQVERILEAGANHYLTKPLDLASFLKVLDDTMKENAS